MVIDSEKRIERVLVEQVRLKGGMCIKLPSLHITGLPDRLCLFPGGKLVFVELKTTKQKPRKIQLIVHEQIRSRGFRVEIIDTLQGVKDLCNQYAN